MGGLGGGPHSAKRPNLRLPLLLAAALLALVAIYNASNPSATSSSYSSVDKSALSSIEYSLNEHHGDFPAHEDMAYENDRMAGVIDDHAIDSMEETNDEEAFIADQQQRFDDGEEEEEEVLVDYDYDENIDDNDYLVEEEREHVDAQQDAELGAIDDANPREEEKSQQRADKDAADALDYQNDAPEDVGDYSDGVLEKGDDYGSDDEISHRQGDGQDSSANDYQEKAERREEQALHEAKLHDDDDYEVSAEVAERAAEGAETGSIEKEVNANESFAEVDASNVTGRFQPGTNFLDALATCTDLECIRDAHELPRPRGVFNFPHFIIIGYQKAATTSLFVHLRKHPKAIGANDKEPNYLTYDCEYAPPKKCTDNATRTMEYLDSVLRRPEYLEYGGKMVTFEASTHIVRGHGMAPALYATMPWVKLIVSLREPISRAASMLIHNDDKKGKGCLAHSPLGKCLLTNSQIYKPQDNRASTYTTSMKRWLEAWPLDQIHVIQYEELIDDAEAKLELHRVKEYLGLDPAKPTGTLGLVNSRKFKIRPEGWPMKREEYEQMVEIVRKDTEELVNLLEKHGKLRDRAGWLHKWETVWSDNLNSCEPGPKGKCSILLS